MTSMMGRRFLLTSVPGPRLLLCPAPGFKAVASERGLESALQPQRLPQARAAQVQAVGGPIRVTELVLDLRGVQRLSAGAARRPAAVTHVQLRGRVERQPTVVELAHDHEAKVLVVHPGTPVDRSNATSGPAKPGASGSAARCVCRRPAGRQSELEHGHWGTLCASGAR